MTTYICTRCGAITSSPGLCWRCRESDDAPTKPTPVEPEGE